MAPQNQASCSQPPRLVRIDRLQVMYRCAERGLSLFVPQAPIVVEPDAIHALGQVCKLAMRHGPVPGCPRILDLQVHLAYRLSLARALEFPGPPSQCGGIVGAMPVPHHLPLVWRQVQPLGRILPQQFVQLVPSWSRRAQKRLVGQRHQVAQRGADHLHGCLAGEISAEHRKSAEHLLLPLVKQAPGVVKGRAYAALPAGHISQVGL